MRTPQAELMGPTSTALLVGNKQEVSQKVSVFVLRKIHQLFIYVFILRRIVNSHYFTFSFLLNNQSGYDNSALAGYANAAAMQQQMRQQQQQQVQNPYYTGGAQTMPAGYGGAAMGVFQGTSAGAMNALPAAGPPSPNAGGANQGGARGGADGSGGYGGAIDQQQQQQQGGGQYGGGAYRGQGATQGRADRSYRPY